VTLVAFHGSNADERCRHGWVRYGKTADAIRGMSAARCGASRKDVDDFQFGGTPVVVATRGKGKKSRTIQLQGYRERRLADRFERDSVRWESEPWITGITR